MAFHLHTTQEQEDYLVGIQLSARMRAWLERFVEDSIRNISDEARMIRSPGENSSCFLVRYVTVDYFGDRRSHSFDFYVDDSNAAYGVLVLRFVDHHIGPTRIRE